MSQPLYVFDMDDTLIDGDCAMIWNEFLVDKGIATDPEFLNQDRYLMSLYARGEMDMEDYLDYVMQPLAALPVEQVHALVDECVDRRIMPRLFDEARNLIATLKAHNTTMLIISASVSFLVEAVAKQVGIPHALGIDMAVSNGHYSSEIVGVPSYREGKVARLEEWLLTHPQHLDEVHFFTDSINDLPLCQHADFAYLVNPCQRLAAHAGQPHWQVLRWGQA
ncbi:MULTISPECIES: HAD-IB family hydrolase [unclassified Vibrio]|uniref:HAD family hydrolase n=1 Tax=unclassified Vibrio TaxID=2614977 RepID=UPI0010A5D9A4|nr:MULTISPECIES: HAD-IB family hydrolase [unclassified Vibrio]WGY45765.1 HAD-IB family hydrolase [Vibrio sp. ABG19]